MQPEMFKITPLGRVPEEAVKAAIRGNALMKKYLLGSALLALTTTPAIAGKPVAVGDGLTIAPSYDSRLRYESVDQANALREAEAVTARLRAGFEIASRSGFSVLVEGEGTLGISNKYNDTNAGNGVEPYSVVADPQNIELNRVQLQYKGLKGTTFTVGRQRINLDDQRFVGSVGWRQNEQTFDAARVESTIGPVMIDATYAWSNRTIFGIDAGPRQAFGGDNLFVTAGVKAGPAVVKGFTFLIEQDEPGRRQFSSQTYGVRATGALGLGGKTKLNLAASYARQSDYKVSTVNYSADYYMAEASIAASGFTLTGNYEVLGSDSGVFAFQTPLATGHKFQGWADLFLTTPNAGIRDINVTLAKKFGSVKALPGLNALVSYHSYKSDFGSIKYGQEWNAQIGFKVRKTDVLLKFADYDADLFGVDTRKIWVQLGWSY